MEYRLLKDLTMVSTNGLLVTAPKGTKLITEASCYFLPIPNGEKIPVKNEAVENNPEWFERVIDWTKEKYFRDGLESTEKNMTQNKIYRITSAEGEHVDYVNDNNEKCCFLFSSPRGKNAVPATEAEYLEQEKKNKKSKKSRTLYINYYKESDLENYCATCFSSKEIAEACGSTAIVVAYPVNIDWEEDA